MPQGAGSFSLIALQPDIFLAERKRLPIRKTPINWPVFRNDFGETAVEINEPVKVLRQGPNGRRLEMNQSERQ